MDKAERRMLQVLDGRSVQPPPIWIMRQAGRYLPEYRATRAEAGSFLDLCYSPDFAVEVTLQPIRRYGFDASILFSDILVLPHALGRDLTFQEGRGPMMTPITVDEIAGLEPDGIHGRLTPVYETVRRLRAELPNETTLIGFCGAPWTVATYMIAGHSTSDQAPSRLFAYRDPAAMDRLLDILADASADYLARQAEAGADVLKIFDSWAGVLDEESFERLCVRPVKRIIDSLRARGITVPVIAFPKGAGALYAGYAQKVGAQGMAIDWTVPLDFARELQKDSAIQGNLDPMRLVAGGQQMRERIDRILEALVDGPFIFNLGHGVTPETSPDHMAQLVAHVRGRTDQA